MLGFVALARAVVVMIARDRQQERRPGSPTSSSGLWAPAGPEHQPGGSCGFVDLLHAEFGAVLDDRATKMFVGTAIAGVMDKAGFEPVSTGERIPANGVGFRTGARYVRSAAKAEPVTAATEGDDDILLTMLAALSDNQRRRLVQMIANLAA